MTIDLGYIGLLFFFISIVFIGEGIIYTLFPNYMKKMLNYLFSLNSDSIRIIGLFFIIVGTIMLYLIL